jgi:hypothetical protein
VQHYCVLLPRCAGGQANLYASGITTLIVSGGETNNCRKMHGDPVDSHAACLREPKFQLLGRFPIADDLLSRGLDRIRCGKAPLPLCRLQRQPAPPGPYSRLMRGADSNEYLKEWDNMVNHRVRAG